jgi:hypothetical protein
LHKILVLMEECLRISPDTLVPRQSSKTRYRCAVSQAKAGCSSRYNQVTLVTWRSPYISITY